MPIYDYRCTDCSSTYDVLHMGKEVQEDVVCPSCGSHNHQRLIGTPNFAMSAKTGGTSTLSSTPSSCSADGGGCCGGSCGLD